MRLAPLRYLLIVLLLLAIPASSFGLMRDQIAKRLERVLEFIDEERYQDAHALLTQIAGFQGNNDYETSLIYQNKAFVEINLERYDLALDSFERALRAGELPPETNQQMRYNLMQLYMNAERFRDAINMTEEWLANRKDDAGPPNAQVFVNAANAASQLQEYDLGIQYVKRAIAVAPKPEEGWYRLWMALHYEQQEMPEVAEVLEILVRLYPENGQYWRELSSIYLSLEDDRNALAALQLADEGGHLHDGDLIKLLFNLYMFLDMPYEAANVLEGAIRRGDVARTVTNYEQLSTAWFMARETPNATEALSAAAGASDRGELELRVAQLYMEQEDWAQAVNHLGEARRKGGFKDESKLWILEGYALYNLKEYERAREVFAEAQKFEQIRSDAEAWVRHIENDILAWMDEEST